MTTVLVVLIIIVFVIAIGGPIAFFQARKVLREQKNYERGLKMVLLLIHIPPPSEDIDIGSRDIRDVTDENISKAQTLYSILASTIKKGYKTKFYGQRHFSLEIVGSRGLIHYYAAVPVALVDVVKQAVISAYPASQLEEVSEQNIFSPIGKLSGTIGGELSLKSDYAYPIATFQEIKRDTMQSLLNALSTLDKEDGAGIQILLRPADPIWRKIAHSVASQKRKGGKGGGGGVLSLSRQIAGMEAEKKSEGGDKKDLSSTDQALVESIEDKSRYPGFEVLIRVVASSNVSHRAEAILNSVVASFSLYDMPGRNGFKYTVAKDMEKFVTAYILRFFPPENNKNILNSIELATLFHFPDRENTPTAQLERQASKQVDGPRNMPETGLLLGYNVFRGIKKPIRLSIYDRQRHLYTVGQTGTGKSTFLENLALQDMLAGRGFAFVDPHGDTAEKLLSMVPKERTEDVIYFSPADTDFPMGLNLFEYQDADQKDFLIQEAIGMLYKLYDPQHSGIMGPRYEHIFRNAAQTVMADPAGGTFIDIPKLFRDPKFVQQKLQYVTDQTVLEFWQKEVPQSQRSNDYGEVTAWFVSKFGAFLSNEMMRNIIGQTKSAFNLRDIMDNGKILLVNLSKGKTGELNSKLLGMVFVMKFQAAAMSRANVPEEQRRDFCLYVDEFQNFSTESFATIMSEARKYHLNLVVANQFTTQLSDEIRDAVFGNMGTIVAFRVGQNDVDQLAGYFQPLFDAEDLLRVPNYNTITRTLVGGVPTQPFSMNTLPSLGKPNDKLYNALKQLSAAKYGRPRSVVEKEIFARLETKEESKPTPAYGGSSRPGFGSSQGGSLSSYYNQAVNQMTSANKLMPPQPLRSPTYGPIPGSPLQSPLSATQGQGSPLGQQPVGPSSAAPVQPIARPGSSSFLDEWLKKRQSGANSTAVAPPTAGQTISPTTAPNPLNPFAQPAVQLAANPVSAYAQPQPSSSDAASLLPSSPSSDPLNNPLASSNSKAQPLAPEPEADSGSEDEDILVSTGRAAEKEEKVSDNNEFKIPHHQPQENSASDTLYIDSSGTIHNK